VAIGADGLSVRVAPAPAFLVHSRFWPHIVFLNNVMVAVAFEGPTLFVESMVATGAQEHPVGGGGGAVVGPKSDVVRVAERRGSGAPNAAAVALCNRKRLSFGEKALGASQVEGQRITAKHRGQNLCLHGHQTRGAGCDGLQYAIT